MADFIHTRLVLNSFLSLFDHHKAGWIVWEQQHRLPLTSKYKTFSHANKRYHLLIKLTKCHCFVKEVTGLWAEKFLPRQQTLDFKCFQSTECTCHIKKKSWRRQKYAQLETVLVYWFFFLPWVSNLTPLAFSFRIQI